MEINNKYHTPEEIVDLFSKLTGRKVDKTFRLFPPFYTDCGKNKTKIIFSDNKEHKNTEIIFEGIGKIKTTTKVQ